ncbi:MAG: imidazole glycerol phosphate synthase subunit HisH [Geminicoccaceae bacterium]
MNGVVVVPTGTANLASVLAAFRRLDAPAVLAERAEQIEAASHVVLPGVGTFGAAMAEIDARGFAGSLRARLAADRPTLGFCVGLQIMFETSEESPGATGLGALAGQIRRFPDTVRVPQFGWNHIEPEATCRFLQPGYAYFANSYHADDAPGCAQALAEHGGRFLAAFERGGILGCQFHPELSGPFGQALIGRWLAEA